jgi:hypothetical protein
MYMSYNFWVAPLEFSSHKGGQGHVPIGDIKNVKETDYVIKTYKYTHFFHNWTLKSIWKT